MALADYYRCDVCERKCIYDADIDDRWDEAGDMKIICHECAKTHQVVIVQRDAT